MIKLSFTQLSQLLKIPKLFNGRSFSGISTDSRTLEKGNLFIAIKGEQQDGHDFIHQAAQADAIAALVQRSIDTDLPCFLVSDTVAALGELATFWRKQFKLPVVAVTGSNGKTTVKNMIASIFQQVCKHDNLYLVTKGNLNNHIGVPLNLTALNAKHRYAVLEIAMNHFGEIAYLSQMVQPTVAVITNAYPSHLEGVNDLDGVAQAKSEIFKGLSETGKAILNADNQYIDYWTALVDKQEVITFGLKQKADVTAIHEKFSLQGTDFLLKTPNGEIEIHLSVPGQHNVMNALAAAAAGISLEIDLNQIKLGLENFVPMYSRLAVKHTQQGNYLLDDTYNANPASLKAAIETLMLYPGQKILVMGDMKELGHDAARLHYLSGQSARESGVNYLLSVGEFAEDMVRGFGENAWAFSSKQDLLEKLKSLFNGDASILVKGSRTMCMEDIVKKLI